MGPMNEVNASLALAELYLFSLSKCFSIHHGKRLGETLKLSRLSRVSGASRSRPASRKLQRLVSVSSRSRRHGSRVSS